jgi:hypothetical protein
MNGSGTIYSAYDYAEERRLIEAGDLSGWIQHVKRRPTMSGTAIPGIEDLAFVAQSVYRIMEAQKK